MGSNMGFWPFPMASAYRCSKAADADALTGRSIMRPYIMAGIGANRASASEFTLQ